ncbi:MAG: Sec-dependent nitrous-oxide reductase [Deltaproteobacteria bacterium]|jgi:nitrous-oxide reductase|nr:Sec-dependent nitrous-oxide reductase [Deltaproteobacteria bacterium]
MQRKLIALITTAAGATALAFALSGADTIPDDGGRVIAGGESPIDQVIRERSLSPDEAYAALKTFVPPGRYDDLVMVTSGGHRGTVLLIGIPSMRILKEIPVYGPDSWEGWGQGDTASKEILENGSFAPGLPTLTWGDLHHPQISMTNGKYDGEWIAVSDKAAGRVGIVSMRDMKTKSIFKVPNANSDHHAVWSDNSDWIVQNSFFPDAVGQPKNYADLADYKDKFRGVASFLRFDRKAGKIDVTQSFQIELPPYFQDMSILGRGPSDGLYFMNSLNTEMATGGTLDKKPPMEVGASAREMDYLHVVNWKKAEQLVNAGKAKVINGIRVLPMSVAAAEGVIYFVPESKSPHGVDLAPGGEYVMVSGKLDPHVSVYSVQKIKDAIAANNVEGKDGYGFPILKYEACLEAHVPTGLGPLHTVYDNSGNAYTSHFLDSTVVKFTMGPPYNPPEKAWKVVDKVAVHYNIGHLQAPASNTKKPIGKYLVALNKWSVDRYPPLGPLHPQNLQLIDISGPKMKLLADMPINGEPHNSQIMPVELLQAWNIYPEVGWDAAKMKRSDSATQEGKERIERKGNTVIVHGTVKRSHYTPDIVRVKEGDKVVFSWTNVETARDATHGFGLHGYNVNLSIDPGATEEAEITAVRPGVYPYYCTEFCSALHMEMTGWLLVEPKKK